MAFLPLALALAPATALAAGSAQVPEPSTVSLVALGLAGVLIGRHAAKRSDRSGKDD